MVRKGYILTEKETAELFLLISHARFKLKDKWKTKAEKIWLKLQDALDLNPENYK